MLYIGLDSLNDRWYIIFWGWNQVWRYFRSNSEPSQVNNGGNSMFVWKLFHRQDAVNQSNIILKSINDLRCISVLHR